MSLESDRNRRKEKKGYHILLWLHTMSGTRATKLLQLIQVLQNDYHPNNYHLYKYDRCPKRFSFVLEGVVSAFRSFSFVLIHTENERQSH